MGQSTGGESVGAQGRETSARSEGGCMTRPSEFELIEMEGAAEHLMNEDWQALMWRQPGPEEFGRRVKQLVALVRASNLAPDAIPPMRPKVRRGRKAAA